MKYKYYTTDKLHEFRNKRFGNLTILDSNVYFRTNDKYYCQYFYCKCDCGNTLYVTRNSLMSGTTKTCGHCYNNRFIILNEYVTILQIYDYKNNDWIDTFINTNCIDYVSNIGRCRILYNGHISNRGDIVISIRKQTDVEMLFITRVIVDYINQQCGLPPLTNDKQIDHISGNTFNNLYYPGDDEISKYYNNLRVCTNRQNNLNRPIIGYINNKNICPLKPYRASIMLENGRRKYKQFSSPQECIDWNESQLSSIDKPFYYYSKLNPRNDPTTFSNTILNAIGYNDVLDCEIIDTDFDDE